MNGGHDAASFEQTTEYLLRSFTGLMLDRDAELESVQQAVLQHLPAAVDDLSAVCNPVHLRWGGGEDRGDGQRRREGTGDTGRDTGDGKGV